MVNEKCEHVITLKKKCIKCTSDFIKEEIINTSDKNLYWGISSKELISEFIDYASINGFSNAIQQEKFNIFYKYALHDKRADFHFILPLNKEANILDVGSGYGNITIPLATWYKSVTAIDATKELLKFSKLRADENGVNNITYIHTDPFGLKSLPCEDKSFDAIIVNGVLEWVGDVESELKPRELQLNFLKDLRRVVKDDGFLSIGIENRWYPLYFYNIPDPHSKVMYTSILFRWMADIVMHLKGNKNGYRDYIYGLSGYRALLKESGWFLKKIYVPWPSYREVDVIYDINNEKVKRYFFSNIIAKIMPKSVTWMYKVLYFLGVEKFFYHSYLLVALPEKDGNLSDSIVEEFIKNKTSKKELNIIKLRTDKNDKRTLIKSIGDGAGDISLSVSRNGMCDFSNQINVEEQ